ncbi:Pseudouridine synthase, catalytic domain-containing protein, partial [Cynara cardunculus var. scolymus]
MKRNREDMEIVWQTPANPPERRDYIFRNGIRYVKPYYFEFISHAKNRWAGKTIVDLFAEEFKGRNRDYYDSAVKSGRIQVDGKTVPVSYRVQSSQKISHFVHRHEPPVMALDVKILHEGEDVLTVYKPASVPVHPCGQYRKNTVVGILQAEHDLAPVFRIQLLIYQITILHNFHFFSAVHRLDRLVSGLLILARSASQADLFRQQIESGMVQKQYIAKVVGEFPEEQVVNLRVNFNAREGRSTTEIRVHLQSTGHPIANDTLYLTEFVDGGSRRTFIAHKGTVKSSHSLDSKSNDDCISESQELIEDFGIDPMCTNCPNLAPIGLA